MPIQLDFKDKCLTAKNGSVINTLFPEEVVHTENGCTYTVGGVTFTLSFDWDGDDMVNIHLDRSDILPDEKRIRPFSTNRNERLI